MSALRARLGSSTVCARKIFLQSINNSKHFAARSVSAKIQNDSTIFRAFSNRQYSTATEQKKDGETLKGTSEKREFQAETRMLLDIVARSLYSDKEVFIRELISNASDALEKFRYLSVSAATEGKQLEQTDRALEIKLITDKQNRTITFQDSGIGMTKEELTQNLGTIARSGSKSFIEEIKKQGADQASSIIGQFGVGFYSAFMVADKIEVSGVYEIQEADGVPIGTKIVVYLKTDCREFSDDETVKGIIKKYSNFIGSPIILNDQQVNSIKPLWLMEPKEVTQEQHVEFYRFIGNSYDKPRFTLHYKTDAPLSIRAVLYVPEGKPGLFELSRDSDVGVSLYSRKILIKSKADNILPKWLRFVKGVVDSEDIPLNLSRELLQNSNLIIKLRTVLTNRFLKFLNDSASKDPVGYDTFYRDYSIFLKEGIVTSHSPLEREDIAKLLRFESSKLEKGVRTSMAEYSSRQKNEQKTIYYLAAPSRELAETSPYFESLKKRDLEVLFCYDTYDELVLLELKEFGGRQLGLQQPQVDELIKFLKGQLEGKVFDVRTTQRLDSHPCVIIVPEMAAARHFVRTQAQNMIMSTLDINKIENEEEKSPDKKQIEAEEKEMMLKTEAENNEINAESKEGEGLVKAALSADVIEQGREVKPKFIPIGAIKMPGFFTRNSDKTKEEEAIEKDPENDKADESAKPKRNHFQFLHTCPFTKFLHHPTQNDKDDSNIDEKKGSRLFNVKYPKIFKKGSSKDPEATLASMETLEDKLDTPNDGMENVKLDPEEAVDDDIVVCCIVVLVLLAVIIGVIVGARAGPPAERPLRLGRYITTISSCGPVEGILDEGVYKFYSIPYALPPIEEKRFTYATPLNNISMCWNDTLQAHNPGPLCMQFLENGTITGEEDCLTLDVVTPHVRYDSQLPVVILIGANTLAGGISPAQPSALYARTKEVVFVRPNFRLGPFGFLALDILSNSKYPQTSGNYGLSDLLAALQWVNLNIQHFGGDPKSVTLLGHRAGATLTAALTTVTKARKLYSRAWLSSGSVIFPGEPLEQSQKNNELFKQNSKCLTDADCLRRLPAPAILTAMPDTWLGNDIGTLPKSGEIKHSWLVLDGDLLRLHAYESWDIQKEAKETGKEKAFKPIVFGTTQHSGHSETLRMKHLNWTAELVEKIINDSVIGEKNLTKSVFKHFNKTYEGLVELISSVRTLCPLVSLSRLRLVAPLYVVMGSGAGGGSARRATAGGAAGSGLAAVDADIEAILGTFDSEVPEQRRFMSSMQQLFYYYVWHGTSPGPDTGLIAVGQDLLPLHGLPACDLLIQEDIVPRYAHVEIMPKYVLVKIVMVTLSIDGYLTNEGIEYLRIFLHLPPEIVPATLKRSARTETVRRGAVGRPDAPARAAEDRSAYRRAPTTPGAPHDKKADVGPGSADVEFVPSSDINKTLIMEDDEIELISGGDKLQEVAQVLQEFIRKNETTFTFPNLNGNNKRVILWAALFQHLQNKASAPIHTLCLAAIRVLSRDKSELENLICEKWITTLIERAGLYNFVGINEESMAPLELPQKEIAIEALKQDIKMKIKDELHGMDYLICCLNEQLKEATPSGENSAMDQDQHFFFTDNQQAISCEILKSMFNLILRPGLEESISEADESMYLKLMPVLTSLLYTQTTNEDKLMELRSNVANLLTSVPPPFYTYLTPVLDPGETAEFVFEGKNMDALQSLVQLLQYRLTGTTVSRKLVSSQVIKS
ncbi:hypothetical protein MSG28_001517 [Choristoneura fumiferana]|uniref:Uncharacterized protein n=1 Tax=Choristoneura fumiferana TaxID=7141 RepID=A0ACC0KUC9_CHOFU|nr:hypothetical protein MSG28_001517 [Choristoneura fumiferana]